MGRRRKEPNWLPIYKARIDNMWRVDAKQVACAMRSALHSPTALVRISMLGGVGGGSSNLPHTRFSAHILNRAIWDGKLGFLRVIFIEVQAEPTLANPTIRPLK